jgi:hypothetical protein
MIEILVSKENTDGSVDVILEGLTKADKEFLMRVGFATLLQEGMEKYKDWIPE